MIKKKSARGVRIISGRWRGRRVSVPSIEGLRPTNDSVREILFNWLMHDIQGARCLDAFAGSGSLGLEALSRGAAFVQFVEINESASKGVQTAIDMLVKEENVVFNYHVVNSSVQQYLNRHKRDEFDLVFLDPPFADAALLQLAVDALERTNVLADRALVYVEQSKKNDSFDAPKNWSRIKSGSSGQSSFSVWLRRCSPELGHHGV